MGYLEASTWSRGLLLGVVCRQKRLHSEVPQTMSVNIAGRESHHVVAGYTSSSIYGL